MSGGKAWNKRERYFSSMATIVIGLAITERECWVISGFDPGDDDETQKLEDEKQNLGFDPCERSHDLTACKNDRAKRSPKRVLSVLTGEQRGAAAEVLAGSAFARA